MRCIVLGGWAKVGAGGLPSAALRAYAAQHVLFHPVRRAAPPTSALAWMAAAERHRRRARLTPCRGAPNLWRRQGSLAHEWLLPRCAAAVHHGGAGTTAASLRAGKPTVVTPVMVDQFFWAQRVNALGVGAAAGRRSESPPRVCRCPTHLRALTPRRRVLQRAGFGFKSPLLKLTPEKLGDAIRRCVESESVRGRADALGAMLREEDGGAAAAALVRELAERKAQEMDEIVE